MKLLALVLLATASLCGACAEEKEDCQPFEVTSPAFGPDETIPARHTCAGPGLSPPLFFRDVPQGTVSLAVVVEDLDAKSSAPSTYWLLWGLTAKTRYLEEGIMPSARGARQGKNSLGKAGYAGPCLEEEGQDQEHRYAYRVLSLDAAIELPAGATREQFDEAVDGRIIGCAELVGRYLKE